MAAHGQRRSRGAAADAEALGAQVAELLKAQDATDILSSCLSEAAQAEGCPLRHAGGTGARRLIHS
jgi:hypothetical protein